MTNGFHKVILLIHKALFHLEAGVTHLGDLRLADDIVMKTDGRLEIEFDVDQYIFKRKPVDFSLEGMFKKTASTHVEVMALSAVVHMVERIKVAHADLDRTREHIL